MRAPILIALAAATALSSPAVARPHGHHNRAERSHDRHQRDRHHRYSSYVAPYRNWRYHRVPVGYRLRPAYYGSRYIITDYGYYGLRTPARNLRWVRYGPDLLLVDIRYGRVVQVIPGRFY